MKLVGVVAMTAALVATIASAQSASAQTEQGVGSQIGITSQQDRAVPDRNVRHPTKDKKRVAGRRAGGAFASVPVARSWSARLRPASTAFDGDWSVLILTQRGACDRAYRYGVQISNGEVLNAGGEPIALEGHVARNGAIRVSVTAGSQEAHGAGHLSRTSGGGSWQGEGSSGTCAGIWEAERRN
jgi:hypothetical protein